MSHFPLSGSEEEAFVFPQSNETEHNKAGLHWRNNTVDSTLSDRSTQTDPGIWTPEKRDKRGYNHNALVHASPERRVRRSMTTYEVIIQEDWGKGCLSTLSSYFFRSQNDELVVNLFSFNLLIDSM